MELCAVSIDNRWLMEAIQKYPELYDKTCREFRDQFKKLQAWDMVAAEMGIPSVNAQKRYSTIRTKFSKYLKSLNLPPGSGTGIPLKPEFEQLRWLLPYISHRESNGGAKSYIGSESEYHGPDSDVDCVDVMKAVELSEESQPKPTNYTPIPPRPRKRQPGTAFSRPGLFKKPRGHLPNTGGRERFLTDAVGKHQELSNDPDVLFCLCLASKLKELTPDQKDEAQIELLKVFRDVKNRSSHTLNNQHEGLISANSHFSGLVSPNTQHTHACSYTTTNQDASLVTVTGQRTGLIPVTSNRPLVVSVHDHQFIDEGQGQMADEDQKQVLVDSNVS